MQRVDDDMVALQSLIVVLVCDKKRQIRLALMRDDSLLRCSGTRTKGKRNPKTSMHRMQTYVRRLSYNGTIFGISLT